MWKHVKTMYMGAALLFLITIFIGFDNILEAPGLPRAQLLTHLHAGSVGWITLAVIATTVWVYTGQREVSKGYEKGIGHASKLALVAFFGYIIAFGVAFNFGPEIKLAYLMLPIFGSASALVIWGAAIFAGLQLRKVPVVSATHLLLFGALVVASFGALMGVLLGLEYTAGFFVPGERIGTHAAMMDTYLFLAASALIGWWLAPKADVKWGKGAMVQVLAWGGGGILAMIVLLLGLGPVMMIALLLTVVGLVAFIVRDGRHMLMRNPFKRDQVAIWFANLFMIIYVVSFVIAIGMYAPKNFVGMPRWVFIVLGHTIFIGTMTNVFFAVIGQNRSHQPKMARHVWLGAIWLMNLGLIGFALGEIFADEAMSAMLMGIGVLTATIILLVRLASAKPRQTLVR